MTTEVSNLENVQELEVAVSGPDGADRLFLCSGIVPIAQEADAGTVTQTWAWRVGPVLSGLQFRRAIAQGGLIRIAHTGAGASWSLMRIDAEWDGESGQVDVRAQVQVIAQGVGASARVEGISYQVSILVAEHPERAAGGLDTAGTPARPPTAAEQGALPEAPPSGTSQGSGLPAPALHRTQDGVPQALASTPSPAEGAEGGVAGPGGLARERRVAERRSPDSRGAASRGPERRRAGRAAPPPLPLPVQGAPQPLQGAAQPPPPTEPAEAAPVPPPPAEAKTPGPVDGTVLVEKLPPPPPPARPTMAGEKLSPPPAPPPPPPVPAAPAQAKVAAPPPVLVLAPRVVDFGAVPVGGFRAKTLTITNTGSGGSGPLEMGFAGADASQFTLTVDPVASANLPPGASGHLLISFQPASPGPKTTTLHIRTMTGVKVEATVVGTTP